MTRSHGSTAARDGSAGSHRRVPFTVVDAHWHRRRPVLPTGGPTPEHRRPSGSAFPETRPTRPTSGPRLGDARVPGHGGRGGRGTTGPRRRTRRRAVRARRRCCSPRTRSPTSSSRSGGADFYRPAHETIYDAIVDLYGRGEPVDPVTVAAELQRRGELARIGGAPYLHTLSASVPIAANAGYYAEIVREKAILRRLVDAGTKIVQMGYAGRARSTTWWTRPRPRSTRSPTSARRRTTPR